MVSLNGQPPVDPTKNIPAGRAHFGKGAARVL